LPAAGDRAWLEAFYKHRFKTIENSDSEEESVGWVCHADPTGGSFPEEDCLLDQVVAVRLRMDKKKAPARWLQIRLTKELRGSGKMSPQRRKEIRQKILDELLPRVLPTVSLIDVLIRPKTRELLLFSTGLGAGDALRKLVLTTFGARAHAADARQSALRARLPPEMHKLLDHAAPTDFATGGRMPQLQAPEQEAEA
jgi:DNA recombination-dependent growth factor C